MKLLAALLALMIAVPPLEAGVCAMQSSGDSGQHASMTHHAPDQPAEHDCCDPEDSEEGRDCSDRMHCMGCSVIAAVVPLQAFPLQHPQPQLRSSFDAGQLAPSHATPPFRPPKTRS